MGNRPSPRTHDQSSNSSFQPLRRIVPDSRVDVVVRSADECSLQRMPRLPESPMTSISSAQPNARFRPSAKPEDAAAVEALVRRTGVFNDEEIAIARELVEENLARGSL